MALTKIIKDMAIIAALDDEPNDVTGLESWDLKAKYDEGGNALKTYINDALVPELEALGVLEILRTKDAKIKHIRLNTDGAIEVSADNVIWEATASSGHIVIDKSGNTLPQRSRLKFANCEVSDNGTMTIVTGVKGDKGDTGNTGAQGVQGIKGDKGDIGAAWYPALDGLGNLVFTLSDTSTPPPVYNIRGPQGSQGIQGAQGERGSTGGQGIQGVSGVQGASGAKGDTGGKGDKGDKGDAGVQGLQGIQGSPGVRGYTGEKGDPGAKGNVGSTGIQGVQGLPGVNGADGRSFVIQDVYPTLGELKLAFPTGNEFAYKVSFDKGIYIWSETAATWVNLGQLQGPQGIQGIQGVQGAKGDTGATGTKGEKGDKGDIGLTGAQGIQGAKGDTGATGDKGDKGEPGVQGTQGVQGVSGVQGAQGIQGIAGADGQSAFDSACAGGYVGTATAFNTDLAGIGTKATKKVPSAAGNFATLDAAGDLADSGKKPSDYASTSHTHEYSAITKPPSAFPPSAHGASHGKNGEDALAPADIGAAVTLRGTVTITTSGWVGSAAPFSYTASVTGVLAADSPHIGCVLSHSDRAADKLIQEAWGKAVSAGAKAVNGQIVLYADEKPTVNVPMQWEVTR